jgi:hypothetical protein
VLADFSQGSGGLIFVLGEGLRKVQAAVDPVDGHEVFRGNLSLQVFFRSLAGTFQVARLDVGDIKDDGNETDMGKLFGSSDVGRTPLACRAACALV